MTDISKYKNVSIDHDSYKRGRILSKNRLIIDLLKMELFLCLKLFLFY